MSLESYNLRLQSTIDQRKALYRDQMEQMGEDGILGILESCYKLEQRLDPEGTTIEHPDTLLVSEALRVMMVYLSDGMLAMKQSEGSDNDDNDDDDGNDDE